MTTLPDRFLSLPIAHRGLHDASDARPENSLSAIRAAIVAGYCIEIDIQRSSDGTAMVLHDYDLRRVTGQTGAVQQRSAAALRKMPLLGSSDTIPTLAQALATVAGQVPILVEIKDQDGAMGPNTGELERAIADAVRDYDGELAVMSFNPHSVAIMANLAPNIPRGLVTGSFLPKYTPQIPETRRASLREIPDFDRTGACFITHNVDDLARPRVAEIRDAGTPVLCWVVKDKATEATARTRADNITFQGYLPQIAQT